MLELLGSISTLALLKVCIDLGKVLKTIDTHEQRINKLEGKVFS